LAGYVERYDYAIWIDASVEVTSEEFVDYMISQARIACRNAGRVG
jgi:hypothetical protein